MLIYWNTVASPDQTLLTQRSHPEIRYNMIFTQQRGCRDSCKSVSQKPHSGVIQSLPGTVVKNTQAWRLKALKSTESCVCKIQVMENKIWQRNKWGVTCITRHPLCNIDFHMYKLYKFCGHALFNLSPKANVRLSPSWFLALALLLSPITRPLHALQIHWPLSDPVWQLYSGCHCLPWQPTNDA